MIKTVLKPIASLSPLIKTGLLIISVIFLSLSSFLIYQQIMLSQIKIEQAQRSSDGEVAGVETFTTPLFSSSTISKFTGNFDFNNLSGALILEAGAQASPTYQDVTSDVHISGNVGIGTITPASKLQMNPPSLTEGLRIISSDYSPLILRNSGDTADLFRVNQSGVVSIPQGAAAGYVLTSDALGNAAWQPSAGGGGGGYWTLSGNNLYPTTIGNNVGIGTASPQQILHLNAANDAAIRFQNGARTWETNGNSSGNFTIKDISAGTTPFTILGNNGNVGIGTAGPAQKLDVNGNVQAGSFVANSNYGGLSWPSMGSAISNDDGYFPKLYIRSGLIRLTNDAYQTGGGGSGLFVSGNNVGIGTMSPGAKLDVNGNIYDSGGSLIFSTTTGTHTAIGNTPGWAAIENAANYNTLMILGRTGGIGGVRSVSLWDRLDVNGNLCINGNCRSTWPSSGGNKQIQWYIGSFNSGNCSGYPNNRRTPLYWDPAYYPGITALQMTYSAVGGTNQGTVYVAMLDHNTGQAVPSSVRSYGSDPGFTTININASELIVGHWYGASAYIPSNCGSVIFGPENVQFLLIY